MSDLKQLFHHSEQVKADADCLFEQSEVMRAIVNMARSIKDELADSHPIVIGIMNGAMIPMGLLLPELDFPLQVDYLHATRYRDKTSGGEMQWLASPKIPLKNRTVLLVDDIHDEGITLEHIKSYCHEQGAAQVYSAVLVNKKHDRKNNTGADFIALEVPDRYVFGFGMDYKGMLRNVSGIYAVKGM
ncbi:hypoxanthine-guanine phosphoribosyltransferase [sulfur-oxidizing endosymbiont of Gigantopelta aegis]|uniref:hypoxanthine-guanine phosphoribosyltransferase n=1 Tax=sulfur-oxidizing endosymbiont of Gigantopelta aegis TaxID=2794934 RepID=UPI0018DEA2D4|nr:hypoxanthine-guanine phosphoribosyltransferase [sulfur-oxidizing endosymbiont of Gigantopelta aegis]